MRNVVAATVLCAVLFTLTGCPPAPKTEAAPEPTARVKSAAVLAEYAEAVRQLYPRAIVGQVTSVDAAEGVAVVAMDATAGVVDGMTVRFFATDPLAGRGMGSIFHVLADGKNCFVNLETDPTHRSSSVQIGDVAAVLRE